MFAWHEQRGTPFGQDIFGRSVIADGRSHYGDCFRTMRWYSAQGCDDPKPHGPRAFKGLMVNGSIAQRDGAAWPAFRFPVGTIFVPSWWATKPAGDNAAYFKAGDMFRYTILQAGANHNGGGTQWAAGHYAGGGWETAVAETLDQMTAYLQPVASSIKNTYASVTWPTAQGTRIPDSKWGGVATRATDDSVEYIHILIPPAAGSRSGRPSAACLSRTRGGTAGGPGVSGPSLATPPPSSGPAPQAKPKATNHCHPTPRHRATLTLAGRPGSPTSRCSARLAVRVIRTEE